MGVTPQTKIDDWLIAASQANKSQSVVDRVVVAGEFLEKTGRMSQDQACKCLKGIDFSTAVEVVRLASSVYVQYVAHHRGIWFTDTGLRPDIVGIAETVMGKSRRRELFEPRGTVHALRCRARSIRDTWTAGQLWHGLTREAQRQLSQYCRGGGVQYVVPDPQMMRKV